MEIGLFFAFVLWVIFYCGIRSNRIWNSMVVWDCLLSICTVWSCVIGFDSLCTYCNASLEQLGLGCCIWESHLSWACFPFPGTRRLWVLAVSDDERGWFILVWNWSLHINIVTFLESVWLKLKHLLLKSLYECTRTSPTPSFSVDGFLDFLASMPSH